MLKCKDELSVMFDAFSLQNVSISKIFEYHELRWITSLCRGKFTEKTSKSVVQNIIVAHYIWKCLLI